MPGIVEHLKHYKSEDGFLSEPAETSTDAVPGSDAKLEAMRKRADNGEDLWHEGDGPEDSID